MRTVLASRSEIVEYDKRQLSAVSGVDAKQRVSAHLPPSYFEALLAIPPKISSLQYYLHNQYP